MSQQPTPAWAAFVAQINEATARKPRKPKPPKTVTANELTRQIVAFIRQQPNTFASRVSSTGVYRADLKKYIPSQQVAGIPDIYACVDGRAVHIEVKVGNDFPSEIQQNTMVDLIRAGAAVTIARNFEEFKAWYTARFLTPPFA